MRPVVAKRRMQFEAGPETTVFYACAAHRSILERGDVSCFLRLRDEPVVDVSPEEADDPDSYPCDFCREG